MMKKISPIAALVIVSALTAPGIETTAWRYQQPFDIAGAGPVRVALPLETLDRLQPDLRDLRIVDAKGAELPYAALELPKARAAYETTASVRRPVSLQINSAKKEITAIIATETNAPLDSVELRIADTADYMLPARVEISDDGDVWRVVATGRAIFRRNQGGRYNAVVQNTLSLNRSRAAFVRVTIAVGDTPVAITDAELRSIRETAAREAPAGVIAQARIEKTENVDDATMLTVDLGAANLTLTELAFDIDDPLFVRAVTIASGGATDEVVARNKAIYRADFGGGTHAESTSVAINRVTVTARRIVVKIANGDSPALRVRGVSVKYQPAFVAFNPAAERRHVFLSSNALARAPRYDIAAFSDKLADMPQSEIRVDALVETPGYRVPEPPGEPSQLASNALFWAALAVVVVVLLVVVAKLLPKPKA